MLRLNRSKTSFGGGFALVLCAAVLLLASYCAACYPYTRAQVIPRIETNLVPAHLQHSNLSILALPLWLKTKPEGFKHTFFYAPPFVVSGDDIAAISERMERYKDLTINMIPHPIYVRTTRLRAVVLLYSNGEIVWLDR